MESKITRIGKYEIVGTLGKGAMGVVYQGFDPVIRRYVAIKTMSMTDGDQSFDQIKLRFQREAQAAGNLNHGNILGVYEYGDEAGLAYITMEYVQGETLAAPMKNKGPFEIDQACGIARQVLSALDHAHAMGVVHRDIKPSNIILTPEGKVKVADFGIARLEASNLTQAGTIMGTPGYMSPEQLKGEGVDHRTDLFSVGVILYEMLTGQKAFSGSTMASVIYKVVHEELPSPSQIQANVPAGLDKVVARAVAKDRDARFDSAGAFAAALDQTRFEPALSAGPAARAPGRATPRPRLGLWAAAAFMVAVVAGVTSWYLVATQNQPVITGPFYEPGRIFADCETCPSLVVLAMKPSAQSAAGIGMPAAPAPQWLAVGRFEVTRSQYTRFITETGHGDAGCATYDGQWKLRSENNWQAPGFPQTEDHPAVCVSWDDAQAFTGWLSRKTGQTYRLLSAAEWEYVANQKKNQRTVPGDLSGACTRGNVADETAAERYPGWEVFACRDQYVHTAPVGSFQPNQMGLYDLAGNIFEWVADCWDETGRQTDVPSSPGAAPRCEQHQLRGGSWFSRPRYVAPSFQNHAAADYRGSSFGLRVAREVLPGK